MRLFGRIGWSLSLLALVLGLASNGLCRRTGIYPAGDRQRLYERLDGADQWKFANYGLCERDFAHSAGAGVRHCPNRAAQCPGDYTCARGRNLKLCGSVDRPPAANGAGGDGNSFNDEPHHSTSVDSYGCCRWWNRQSDANGFGYARCRQQLLGHHEYKLHTG